MGRSNSALSAASPQLADWTAIWAQALPGFTPDSMWLVHRSHWSPAGASKYDLVAVGRGADPEGDLAFELLGLRSPDRRYTLDVDSYQAVLPDRDSLIVGGEPDSRCSLIDERRMTELVLQQCGTPGGFHWGRWLSNASFAVGGRLSAT